MTHRRFGDRCGSRARLRNDTQQQQRGHRHLFSTRADNNSAGTRCHTQPTEVGSAEGLKEGCSCAIRSDLNRRHARTRAASKRYRWLGQWSRGRVHLRAQCAPVRKQQIGILRQASHAHTIRQHGENTERAQEDTKATLRTVDSGTGAAVGLACQTTQTSTAAEALSHVRTQQSGNASHVPWIAMAPTPTTIPALLLTEVGSSVGAEEGSRCATHPCMQASETQRGPTNRGVSDGSSGGLRLCTAARRRCHELQPNSNDDSDTDVRPRKNANVFLPSVP